MIALGVDALCWHAQLATQAMTIEDVIAQAAELQASYVQLGVGYFDYTGESKQKIADVAAASGVKLRASGEVFGSPFFDKDSGKAVEQIRIWLDEAQQLGSTSLMLATGVYRADFQSQDEIDQELDYVRRVLDSAADAAAERGVQLSVENSSDFDTPELKELLASLAGRCELFLDIANPVNLGEDPVTVVEELGSFASSGHIKDIIRTSIWNFDRAHRYGYSVEFAYPGEGTVLSPRLIAAIKAATADREFFLGIEGLNSRVGVTDQLPRLHKSLSYLREVLA